MRPIPEVLMLIDAVDPFTDKKSGEISVHHPKNQDAAE